MGSMPIEPLSGDWLGTHGEAAGTRAEAGIATVLTGSHHCHFLWYSLNSCWADHSFGNIGDILSVGVYHSFVSNSKPLGNGCCEEGGLYLVLKG